MLPPAQSLSSSVQTELPYDLAVPLLGIYYKELKTETQILVSVQFSSVTQSCPTLRPHESQHARPLSITNFRSSLRLTSIESVMPSSHPILCHPLLLLPPIPPSIRVFSNESTLRMRWSKYWSFSFSIIPSKEHPGLISFRMDWLDLLAVQGTLQESSPTPQFKSINS